MLQSKCFVYNLLFVPLDLLVSGLIGKQLWLADLNGCLSVYISFHSDFGISFPSNHTTVSSFLFVYYGSIC